MRLLAVTSFFLHASSAFATSITGFTLYNADTDKAIGPIKDGDVIYLDAVGKSLNIQAVVDFTPLKVVFNLNGVVTTEKKTPYFVGGDDAKGDVYPTKAFESFGTFKLKADAYNSILSTAAASASISFTISPLTPSSAPTMQTPFPIFINAGGGNYTDKAGNLWDGDEFYSGGAIKNKYKQAIAKTNDDLLYQTERYGKGGITLSYNIPVPKGEYKVVLHFCELYYYTTGARVFGVNVEGTVVAASLDIYAMVKQAVPYLLTTTVSVADGMLSVDLTPQVENPKISAIAVHKA